MITSTLRQTLLRLGSCARKAAIAAPSPLTPAHSELLVGIGNCGDWFAWASRLRGLDFATSIKRGSPRSQNFLESTRFSYTWTGTNALFARDAVLTRLVASPLPTGEFERFKIISLAAGPLSADQAALLATLHSTLALPRSPRDFPWVPLSHIRIIDLIYYKYTPDSHKKRGAAKFIHEVVTAGAPVTDLDLPTIIYCTRNWMTHGALLNSSFRGSPKQFHAYIVAVTEALALIVGDAASALEATMP